MKIDSIPAPEKLGLFMFTLYENGKLLGDVSNWLFKIPADKSMSKQCQFSIVQMVNMNSSHQIYFEGAFKWNVKIIADDMGLYLANIL